MTSKSSVKTLPRKQMVLPEVTASHQDMRVSVWDVRGRPVRVEELDEPFLTVDQASGEFRIF